MANLDFEEFSYADSPDKLVDKLNEMRRLLHYGVNLGNLSTANVNSSIKGAVNGFNGRNDRSGTAITLPTIATDGTAIDHTLNTDGSANISLEWLWAGANSDIDGWNVYVCQADTNAVYAFGDVPANEQVFYADRAKRAFFLYGVPANKYYTFGVQACRIVDPDVAPTGVIATAIVKPTRAEEAPYRPASSVAFTGDVSGTVSGLSAADLIASRSGNAYGVKDCNALFHFGTHLKSTQGLAPAGTPVATLRPGEGKFGGAVTVEEGTINIVTKSDPTLLTDFPVNSGVTITSGIVSFLQGGVYFIDNTIARFAYMAPALQPNTTYTVSVYVRMDDGLAPIPGSTSTSGDFSLVGEGGLISTNPIVISCGSGLYRVSATFSIDATVSSTNIGVVKYTTQSARGFKTSGLQVEAKSFATSYVPTAGTAITRATGSLKYPKSMLNAAEGTVFFYGRIDKFQAGLYNPILATGTTMSGGGRLLIMREPADNSLKVWDGDGTTEVSYKSSASTLVEGQWFSGAVTWGLAGRVLYLNGIQVATNAKTSPIGFNNTDGNVHFGSWSDTSFLNGLLDELRIDSKQRTSAEIKAWYDSAVAFTDAFLVDTGQIIDSAISTAKITEQAVTGNKVVTVIDDRDPAIVYTPSPTPPGADMNPTGPWYQWYGSMYYYNKTYTVGDGALGQTQSLEYTFTGSSIFIIGGVWIDSGKIDVYIDNVFKATVDTFIPFTGADDWSIGRAELYKVEGLPFATHTIKIVVRTDKNAASTAYKFYFDGFRVGQGLNVKALDILVADQYVNVTTNANGYGELNVGGYEPGGQTGNYLILCLTGARLFGSPNPNSTTTPKPKVGVKGQYLYVWDGPVNSTVQIEFSALLMPK